nr:hypothetical protein [Eubacterium sp.]
NTYWDDYKAFDEVTISEAALRARAYLTSTYDVERKDNTITLSTRSKWIEGYYILRTHSEEITGITGGTYEKIQDDAYLITTEENEVVIKVKDTTESSQFSN